MVVNFETILPHAKYNWLLSYLPAVADIYSHTTPTSSSPCVSVLPRGILPARHLAVLSLGSHCSVVHILVFDGWCPLPFTVAVCITGLLRARVSMFDSVLIVKASYSR